MNDQTIDKMKTMKLYGMLQTFRTSLENQSNTSLTTDEFISMLVQAEWDERYNRKLDRSLKKARFRYKAAIEQIFLNGSV